MISIVRFSDRPQYGEDETEVEIFDKSEQRVLGQINTWRDQHPVASILYIEIERISSRSMECFSGVKAKIIYEMNG